MATAPADQRPVFIAAALFAVSLGILATRYTKAAMQLESQPLPTADLHALAAFLVPLSDTSAVARVGSSGIVVGRDPFVAGGVAPVESGAQVNAGKPVVRTAPSQPWIVSTILVEGSRRSAIVNDAWVTVGDSLAGGSHLTAVEPDHIVVTDAKGVRHRVSIQGGGP
jgi:hypothetical protein